MSKGFIGENDPNFSDDMAKKAEEASSRSRDRIDGMTDEAKDIADHTYKNADDVANDPRVSAHEAKKKIKEKTAEKRAKSAGKKSEKLEIDLDKYTDFVDKTTSRHSQTTADYKERIEELVAQGCNLARLDTAASGLVAEAGEFMEIVKKIKFQGKEYNDANKEHLQKELGDIMWYVAQAGLALGVRLDEVIYLNTLKLAARYPTGEFTEIIKKIIFQGKPVNNENLWHLKRELGDVMWYVMQACMGLGVDLDEVIEMNIDKLKSRYPGGEFDAHYSENRKEGDL